MSIFQAIILGIIQGATEFLPVSSSGHLVIIPRWLGWPDPGLSLDVILHLATMIAVVVYFRKDIYHLILAGWNGLRQRQFNTPEMQLILALIIGTIPGALAGVFLKDWIEGFFSAPQMVGFFLILTAIVLTVSEQMKHQERTIESITWLDGLLIGLAQGIAVLPGLSRSGSTIAAGLVRGFQRPEAARFSFLLSIPIILGSGGYEIFKALRHGIGTLDPVPTLAGFCAALITGYIAIAGLLALIRRQSLWPFALYCAILGSAVVIGLIP